jgi:hypothetical protein
MSESIKVELSAYAQLPITHELQDCADQLNSVLSGFKFERDEDSRFDEYPAFVAEACGIEIALLGIPYDEESDRYILQISTRVEFTVPEWHTALADTFLQALLHRQPLPGAWRLDLSDDLARYLQDHGIPGCKAMPAA